MKITKSSIEILVTGGSGFLGNAVVVALRAKHPDWKITVVDLRPPIKSDNRDGFILTDIRSAEDVDNIFDGYEPDAIIHTAGLVPDGQTRYSQSSKDRDRIFGTNCNGTSNILSAAKKAGVRALVYTSSCTVVTDDQNHDYPNMTEDIPIGFATLLYGQSKAHAERLVLAANDTTMKTCALRPSTIIGHGDAACVPTIYACIAKGETPYVVGTGDNLYDFVYVTNAADAHVLAVENLLSSHPTAAGEAFFISNQEPIYFRDFCLACWKEFGHVPKWQIRIPANLAWFAGWVAEWTTWCTGKEATLSRGSVEDAVGTRYANGQKARQFLGYVPKVGMAEAIKLSCKV
ncbi:hypothetical protein LTR66_011077 [Elasticomyces elasticus]|nr:hypothetical protein LTR66_011077 [Elasticomyces elasticus]KAK4987594.1 hypothetical protein LTR50_004538 [Elasticomyces elasticus]